MKLGIALVALILCMQVSLSIVIPAKYKQQAKEDELFYRYDDSFIACEDTFMSRLDRGDTNLKVCLNRQSSFMDSLSKYGRR